MILHRLRYLLLALTLVATSCYEDQAGCTDVLAENFSIKADKDCEEECCEYPDLKLIISNLMGQRSLSLDSIYQNQLGQAYSFKYIAVHFADFQVIMIDGGQVSTHNALTMSNAAGETKKVANDVVQHEPPEFRYEVDEWIGAGDIAGLRFDVGLDQDRAGFYPEEQGHFLNTLGDSLLVDGDLVTMYVALDSLPNSDYHRYRLPASLGAQTIQLDTMLTATRGVDVEFVLKMDFQTLFDGVDFTGTDDEVEAHLWNQLPKSISLK